MFKTDGYLKPLVIQSCGLVLLVVVGAFWAVTGHESALLVGASLTLIGVGSASGALVSVRHELETKQEDADQTGQTDETKKAEKTVKPKGPRPS